MKRERPEHIAAALFDLAETDFRCLDSLARGTGGGDATARFVRGSNAVSLY